MQPYCRQAHRLVPLQCRQHRRFISDSAVSTEALSSSESVIPSDFNPKTWAEAAIETDGVVKYEYNVGRLPGMFSAVWRTWDFLDSMPDALKAIQAVERRYGPLDEFTLDKDKNDASRYQIFLKLRFRDTHSLSSIPLSGDLLHIPLGKPTERRPGGIGLSDLEGLLVPGEYDPTARTAANSTEALEDQKMVDGKLSPNRMDIYTLSTRIKRSMQTAARANAGAQSFVRWGGFHTIQPIHPDTIITDDGSMDNPVMRVALRRWCQTLGISNPHELDLSGEASNSGWDPLNEKDKVEIVEEEELSLPGSAEYGVSAFNPSPKPSLLAPQPRKTFKPKKAVMRPIVSRDSAETLSLREKLAQLTAARSSISKKDEETKKQILLAQNLVDRIRPSQKKKNTASVKPVMNKLKPVKPQRVAFNATTNEKPNAVAPSTTASETAPVENKDTGMLNRLKGVMGSWF